MYRNMAFRWTPTTIRVADIGGSSGDRARAGFVGVHRLPWPVEVDGLERHRGEGSKRA